MADIEPMKSKKEMKQERARARIQRDRYRLMCFTNQLQAALKFELDSDIVHMRAGFQVVRASTY